MDVLSSSRGGMFELSLQERGMDVSRSTICPSEPKYNRMLIDFLGRCVPVREKTE